MIPSATIDEIRNKSDILQIVGEYVPMKKRGKNYLGLCPFHSEKTASFTVSPDKQIFHCFGCGEGGNVFAFLMKIENISFGEAVELLGERTGIAVKKEGRPYQAEDNKERYFSIMDMALQFFRNNLDGAEGAPAKEYVSKRQITEAALKAFALGYATPQWDGLYNHLFKKGVPQKDMETLGLIIQRNDKSGYYDRFRGRLMFPIFNVRGRVIGFSGRILTAGAPEEGAKYVNSPDSPIYNKGFSLYGISVTKEEIKKAKTAVLLEGNVDLISCWQNGIKNVVAPLGTALTQNQAKTIRRFAENVVIAFDADSAGGAATARSVDILRDEGLNVHVARYTGGKDPDEALKADKKGFIDSLDHAMPWIEYKIITAISKYDLNEIESRAKAAKEAAAVIGNENDEMVRKGYMKLVAEKLGFGLEEISAEVKRLGFYVKRGGDMTLKRTVEKPASKIEKAEESLIKLTVVNKGIMDSFMKEIDWQEFTGKSTRLMAELLQTADLGGTDVQHFLLENLPDEGSKKEFSRIMMSDQPESNMEKTARDCINTIKGHHLQSKLEHLRGEIVAAEKEGRLDSVSTLHKEFKDVNEAYRSLSI